MSLPPAKLERRLPKFNQFNQNGVFGRDASLCARMAKPAAEAVPGGRVILTPANVSPPGATGGAMQMPRAVYSCGSQTARRIGQQSTECVVEH